MQVKSAETELVEDLNVDGTPSQCLDFIRAKEVPVSNLESSLLSTHKNFANIYALKHAMTKSQNQVQHNFEGRYVSKYDRTLVNEESRRKKLGETLGGIDVKGSFGFQSKPTIDETFKTDSSTRTRNAVERPHKVSKTGQASRRPIVLVPPGFSTLINMYNAKDFLESGRYVPSTTKKKGKEKKEDILFVSRTFGREQPVTYEVTDRCPSRNSARYRDFWSRVVCAFVTGAKWQMADWPFKGIEQGNMVDTFAHVKGFHLKYDTDTITPIIQSWDVTVLNLDKNNRHKDQALIQEFWTKLDRFVGRRHAHLKF